jgi:hypothetical protein
MARHERSRRRRFRIRGFGVNRIGRRIMMCMLLIAALAVIWNLLGH